MIIEAEPAWLPRSLSFLFSVCYFFSLCVVVVCLFLLLHPLESVAFVLGNVLVVVVVKNKRLRAPRTAGHL